LSPREDPNNLAVHMSEFLTRFLTRLCQCNENLLSGPIALAKDGKQVASCCS